MERLLVPLFSAVMMQFRKSYDPVADVDGLLKLDEKHSSRDGLFVGAQLNQYGQISSREGLHGDGVMTNEIEL